MINRELLRWVKLRAEQLYPIYCKRLSAHEPVEKVGRVGAACHSAPITAAVMAFVMGHANRQYWFRTTPMQTTKNQDHICLRPSFSPKLAWGRVIFEKPIGALYEPPALHCSSNHLGFGL